VGDEAGREEGARLGYPQLASCPLHAAWYIVGMPNKIDDKNEIAAARSASASSFLDGIDKGPCS
jgi:hypothetical protein